MLPSQLKSLLEQLRRPAWNFLDPDKTEIYDRCVDAALEEPAVARLLGKRPGATPAAVHQEMSLPWYRSGDLPPIAGHELQEYEKTCRLLEQAEARLEAVEAECEWDWRIACTAAGVATLAILMAGGLMTLVYTVLATSIIAFALFWSGAAAWDNLRLCLKAARTAIAWLTARFTMGISAAYWGEALYEKHVKPIVQQMVHHLLGDDPDSLFIPEGKSRGLRAPRAPGYIVPTESMKQLRRKLTEIEDGTVAVCGPRGVGKSTLLESSVELADFGFVVQAPATYAPHDFLLSMSVRLCEEYIDYSGYEVPEFTRLSPLHRFLRRARMKAKGLGRWAAFALPAAGLLVLGLSAPARSLYAQYAASTTDYLQTWAAEVERWALDVWNGHAAVAGLMLCLAGIAWWKTRHNPWLPRMIGGASRAISSPLGRLLQLGAAASVVLDPQIRALTTQIHPDVMLNILVLAGSWWITRPAPPSKATVSSWQLSFENTLHAASTAVAVYLLHYLIQNPTTHAILADSENPLRLAGVFAGTLIAKVGGLRLKPAESDLVTRCRNHLYRLQTIQMTTNTMSASSSLGGSHATSVSTIPPNFPALVEEFRDLLSHIAADEYRENRTVLIAIDEVDRLGSDDQARAFLSEIKAILGVRHVYYLISVADDVGAAFVRRGLPHRDVTDSSLDDIIHVPASTLTESREVLAARSETLSPPYVLLAHALSGGILRDLLRYGLQIEEIQARTRSHELNEIARNLILEELSETLAGFRTLLSKRRWTNRNSMILNTFGEVCGYLPTPCPCTEGPLRVALERFAFYGAMNHPELEEDTQLLIDEASAYSYFSLTLLDIFSTPRLDHRTEQAAQHGLTGSPERFAEARLELGISPYSARPLIDTIRKAWSLPLHPTTEAASPDPDNCPLHKPEPPQQPGLFDHLP